MGSGPPLPAAPAQGHGPATTITTATTIASTRCPQGTERGLAPLPQAQAAARPARHGPDAAPPFPKAHGVAAPLPLARDSKGSSVSSLRMWASSSRGAMGDASPRQLLPAPGARTGPSCPSGTAPGAEPL